MTRITIRYFEGCPHWRLADARVRQALQAVGLNATVEYDPVETHEDAARTGFHGSPTILVDGADPWADGDASAALSCRIYRTEEGPQGAPTVRELEAVLSRRP